MVEREADGGLERLQDQADEVAVAAENEPAAVGMAGSQQVEDADGPALRSSPGLATGRGEVGIRPRALERPAPVVDRVGRQAPLAQVGQQLDLEAAPLGDGRDRLERARVGRAVDGGDLVLVQLRGELGGGGPPGLASAGGRHRRRPAADGDRLGVADEEHVERGEGRSHLHGSGHAESVFRTRKGPPTEGTRQAAV